MATIRLVSPSSNAPGAPSVMAVLPYRLDRLMPSGGHVTHNASEVAEPASIIRFPGSATFPTEIWLPGSARKKAGWLEGRRRRPKAATFLLSDVGSRIVTCLTFRSAPHALPLFYPSPESWPSLRRPAGVSSSTYHSWIRIPSTTAFQIAGPFMRSSVETEWPRICTT